MTPSLKVQIRTECDKINQETPTERIVELGLTAPAAAEGTKRLPLNLGLCIDRSGSMGGEKLEQVKTAVLRILEMLNESDLLTITCFHDEIYNLCVSAPCSLAAKQALRQQVTGLHPGGSTNLCGGYLACCQGVAVAQSEQYLNRVVLLTDGMANVGETDPQAISHHSRELFTRGMATSTFGVGLGFNEMLLQMMAEFGGGRSYYIEQDAQLAQFLLAEFNELAQVSLRRAAFDLTFPTSCSIQVLGDWPVQVKRGSAHVELSDMAAETEMKVLCRLLLPPGSGEMELQLKASGLTSEGDELEGNAALKFTYAPADEVGKMQRDPDLLASFATVTLGQVTRQAIQMERDRKYAEAEKLLSDTLLLYGENAPLPIREQYVALKERIRFGLHEDDRKNMNSEAFYLKRQFRPDIERRKK